MQSVHNRLIAALGDIFHWFFLFRLFSSRSHRERSFFYLLSLHSGCVSLYQTFYITIQVTQEYAVHR
jgi:hypothetical protein